MPAIGNLKDSTDDSVRVVMVCLIEELECTTVIAVFKEEFLCVENFFQRVALNVFHIGNTVSTCCRVHNNVDTIVFGVDDLISNKLVINPVLLAIKDGRNIECHFAWFCKLDGQL